MKRSKYGNIRTNGYASRKEAHYAARFQALAKGGRITDLEEQVRIVLVAGKGKDRSIVYVADFRYVDEAGFVHVVDVKGMKTQVYQLKKKMAKLLLGIEIEEV